MDIVQFSHIYGKIYFTFSGAWWGSQVALRPRGAQIWQRMERVWSEATSWGGSKTYDLEKLFRHPLKKMGW